MTPETLLQLTRELVASPHFSYQPQMRLRNGAIVLEVHEHSREYKGCGVGPRDLTVYYRKRVIGVWLSHLEDDADYWLPDLEDDATVGVLRGMVKRVLDPEVLTLMSADVATGETWARALLAAP